MSERLSFHHIHLISEDAHTTAKWYVDNLGATLNDEIVFQGAPQFNISIAGLILLIRGVRPGENPSAPSPMQDFETFSSHNTMGTDHFGFNYQGDLRAYCEELRAKGVRFSVEPWEIALGILICYIAAPDGVSIELVKVE
jgi:lactoylglutathione lyase